MHAVRRTQHDLRQMLRQIDGKGYRAYKDLRGVYDFEGFELHIDHVQGDPFAAPSRLRVVVWQEHAGIPTEHFERYEREIGVRDYLARRFGLEARRQSGRRGSGKSGAIDIMGMGQEILDRSSCLIDDEAVEVRFTVGLPAQGRRVLGRQAMLMLCEDVPEIVRCALLAPSIPADRMRQHVEVAEDAEELRAQLAERDLVAFVPDGAILARSSGVDDRPMDARDAVPFTSPESLRVTLEAPHAGPVTGMGIPRGITLVVGGGYHGKSTLLDAIKRGVYDHVPGDGREQVVTAPGAVSVRAEDGRAVAGVDISGFIDRLPGERDTRAFTTRDASGSTSQAASIVEALQVGADVLLMDEDTSATNFMLRDERMRALIANEEEPITPFVQRVEELWRDHGVSTILVVGGTGAYFDVAHTVIAMKRYAPEDLTVQAKEIARRMPTAAAEPPGPMNSWRARRPRASSIDASRGRKGAHVRVRRTEELSCGEESIDLGAVEQIVAAGQVRAIAEALLWMKQRLGARAHTVRALIEDLEEVLWHEGLEALARGRGDLAMCRGVDVAAALNRLRSLEVATSDD
ncbi:MAG: ABC-ATPase domain-containing protein [Myxococcota bacterium]